MQTILRQIGNSRGVLIPAAFLASCQIEDQVDMQLMDGHIVIKPVQRALRNGWFVDAPATNEAADSENAESVDWEGVFTSDDSEWVW